MYVFSICICIIALVTSVSLVAVTIQMNLFSLLLIGSQIGVYMVIARFAWLCRKHQNASITVTLMALVAAGLGCFMMFNLIALVSSSGFGLGIALIVLPIYGQMVAGLCGCYIGYAIVEYRANIAHRFSSFRGKLIVIFMMAAIVAFAAILWVFA